MVCIFHSGSGYSHVRYDSWRTPAPFEWYPVFTIRDMSIADRTAHLIGFEQKVRRTLRNWQVKSKAKKGKGVLGV